MLLNALKDKARGVSLSVRWSLKRVVDAVKYARSGAAADFDVADLSLLSPNDETKSMEGWSGVAARCTHLD
jgi:hypothetical protein